MKTRILSLYRILLARRNIIYTLGLPILIVASSLLYYFSFYLRFITLTDEGFLVNGALRVLEGEVPLSDFWSYPPGRYYLLAGLFLIFGVNLATERIMWITLMTIRNLLVYTVSRRLLSPIVSLLLASSIMLIPGPWRKTPYSILMFIHILVVFKYIEKPGATRAMLIGVIAGLTLYFRQDHAVFALLVNFVAILAAHLLANRSPDLTTNLDSWRAPLFTSGKHIKSMLVATALSIAPILLFYGFQDEFALALRRIGPSPIDAVSIGYERTPFPSVFELKEQLMRWPLTLSNRFANVWFPYFLLFVLIGSCGITILFIVRWLRGKTIDTKQLSFLMVVLAWTGLSSYKAFGAPTFRTFVIASQGTLILAAFLLGVSFVGVQGFGVQKKGRYIAQSYLLNGCWRWALFIFLLVVVGFSWYFLVYRAFQCRSCGSIAIAKRKLVPFSVARAQLMLPPRQAKELQDIIVEIRSRTSENDNIFAYQHAMFYFLSERRNATQLDNLAPPATIDEEAAILVDDLQKNPPKLQIIRLSARWLAEGLSRFPCAAQDAFFGNYQVVATHGDYLFLQFDQGSNAWEAVQEEFAKRGHELTRALDCQP